MTIKEVHLLQRGLVDEWNTYIEEERKRNKGSSHLQIHEIELSDLFLENADLSNIIFQRVTINNCTFYDCNIDNSDFHHSRFHQWKYGVGTLIGSRFENCEFINSQIWGTYIEALLFIACDFTYSKLYGLHGSRIKMVSSTMIDSDIDFIVQNELHDIYGKCKDH